MTKEIALHCMKSASELERELCEECPIYGQTGCDHCYEDALQYVIDMLEQEPILDKIRAEIVELTKCPYGTECLGANCPSNTDCMICGDHVLEILDKYEAETENP